MAQSIEAWYYGLPQLTRFYLSVCFLFTLLSTFGLLNPLSLYLDLELVWTRFQLWRLPTCFMFLGKFSFPFLMQLMILYVPRSMWPPTPLLKCLTDRCAVR
jgi:Derlin-2/3